MADEFSPEEKLLKLIRGDKPRPADKIAPLADKKAGPVESFAPIHRANAGTKPKITQSLSQKESKYFKIVNSILITVLIAAIVFFAADIVTSKLNFNPPVQKQRHIRQQAQRTPAEDTKHPDVPALSTSRAEMGNRELFKPLRSEIQEKVASQITSQTAQDAVKNLSLIGIIAGEKPQAVVEDKQIQKTYFLYKGQTINQLIVEDILEDRVILDFEEEKVELVL